MIIETKEEWIKKKFLGLDSWAHRAYGLVTLGVVGEKVDEALKETQNCLNECRKILKE